MQGEHPLGRGCGHSTVPLQSPAGAGWGWGHARQGTLLLGCAQGTAFHGLAAGRGLQLLFHRAFSMTLCLTRCSLWRHKKELLPDLFELWKL